MNTVLWLVLMTVTKMQLEKCGINVTIRREMGSDIDGACGQLRKSYMEKSYDPQ